ncbi:MAG: lysophospholipase [Bacteroidota bacterium]|nr:lysophospholipase [Bacteroidota bacterium]
MIKFFGWLIFILILIYIVICLLIFFFQERFLFFPQKLPADTHFTFPYKFEEFFIEAEDGVRLNGLLFKSAGSEYRSGSLSGMARGLVFYLHGNAGALNNWGYAADEFLGEGFDVFILDYRGYGKSEGNISSQNQLLNDVELAFQEVSKLYQAQEIIITGYSIGTGPACWLASRHPVDKLLLIAPFYNLTDLANHYFPFLPSFILRYPLKNNQYLEKVEAPVTLIHGKNDEIIPHESSLRLKDAVKKDVNLFILDGLGHNNITGSLQFRKVIREVLKEKE